MAEDKATGVRTLTREQISKLWQEACSQPEPTVQWFARALLEAAQDSAHTCTQPQAGPELVRAITELTSAVERLTLSASRIHARM